MWVQKGRDRFAWGGRRAESVERMKDPAKGGLGIMKEATVSLHQLYCNFWPSYRYNLILASLERPLRAL